MDSTPGNPEICLTFTVLTLLLLAAGGATGSSEEASRAQTKGTVSGPAGVIHDRIQGSNQWLQKSPAASPPPVLYPTMVYDSVNDQFVLVIAFWILQTWTYSVTSDAWVNRTPATGPSARANPQVAFDKDSGKVILFGGRYGPAIGETWAYDFKLNAWTNMIPSSEPPPRFSAATTYDAKSDRIVMHGGCLTISGGACTSWSPQTWSYDFDNNTWALRTSSGPSARSGHSMAYDSARGRSILFGGYGGGFQGDTWDYDHFNNSWNWLTNNGPSGRYGFGMCFDDGSDRAILFGGWTSSSNYDATTWAFDPAGPQWSNMVPSPAPVGRNYPAFAHDSSGDVSLLHGGYTGAYNNETWTYELGNLPGAPLNFQAAGSDQQVSLDWSAPASDGGSPITNYRIYRGTTSGGETFLTQVGDVLTYDDTGLTNGQTYYYYVRAVNVLGEGPQSNEASATPQKITGDWTRLNPTGNVPAMSGQMAYDPKRHQFVYFGVTAVPQTWVFEIDQNRWVNRSPAPQPEGRFGMGVALDTRSDRLVIFGGYRGPGVIKLDSTWVYDIQNNTWSNVTSGARPPARWSSAMTYDADSDRIVMFGGCMAFSGGCTSYASDTWGYDVDAMQWTQRLSGTPGGRSHLHMTYDPGRDRTVMFGGYDGAFLPETWSYDYDNNSWSNLNPASLPAGRYNAPIAFDIRSDRAMVFGGWTAAGSTNDETWTLSPQFNRWSDMVPLMRPSGRNGATMAYDPQGDLTYLYGGTTGANETWTYRFSDAVAPVVVSTSPANGTTGVALDASVKADFNVPMEPISTTSAFSITPPVPNSSASVSGSRLTWSHPTDFAQDVIYTVKVSTAAKSAAGVGMVSPYSFNFLTRNSTIPIPPKVVSTDPPHGTTSVAVDKTATVVFDLDMEPTSTTAAFSISPAVSGGIGSVSGNVLTWSHTSAFQPQTIYLATISKSAKSKSGDNMIADHTFTFATGNLPKPPQVQSTDPKDGTVGVPLDKSVSVTFDMAMDATSTSAAFSIDPPAAGGSALISGNLLTWTHSTPLQPDMFHEVTIAASAKSLAGDSMSSPYTFRFVTSSSPKPLDPDRIVFKVPQPSVKIGESVNVDYIVYDPSGVAVATNDSWDFAPKDVADVKYSGGLRFSVKGLKAGNVKITVTAKGDAKSVTNSTTLKVVADSPPPPDDGLNTQVMGIPVWALLLAVLLAAIGIILFLFMMRRSRNPPPTFTPFTGDQGAVMEAIPSEPPPPTAPAPLPKPQDIERDETPGSPPSRNAARRVAGEKTKSRRPPPPPPPRP